MGVKKNKQFSKPLWCVYPSVSARRPSTFLRCLRLSLSLRLSPTRLSAGREYSCQLIDPGEIDSWAGGSRERGRQIGERRFSGRQRGDAGIRSFLVLFIYRVCVFNTPGSSVCCYTFARHGSRVSLFILLYMCVCAFFPPRCCFFNLTLGQKSQDCEDIQPIPVRLALALRCSAAGSVEGGSEESWLAGWMDGGMEG